MGVLDTIHILAEAPEEIVGPALEKACMGYVQAQAMDTALNLPQSTGILAGSIKTTKPVAMGDGTVECQVGTNLVYAPYVEYGTGAFSSLGTGRKGYWVYVKGSDGSVKSHNPKEYTLEEAKQVMAILRSKGLQAFYTCGRPPRPFLGPACDDNRENVANYIKEAIINAGLSQNANN